MDIISVEQMRQADRYTIEKGTPSKELMRRAAQGVFDTYPGWDDAKTLIVCGPGNNGGDGYALAAIMKDHDLDVTILRVSEKFRDLFPDTEPSGEPAADGSLRLMTGPLPVSRMHALANEIREKGGRIAFAAAEE